MNVPARLRREVSTERKLPDVSQSRAESVHTEATGTSGSFLGRSPSNRAPLLVAAGVGALALIVVPWESHLVGQYLGFLPAILAVVACLDLLSMYVLLAEFRSQGDRRALAMGWVYAWSLVIMLGYAFAFPGVFSVDPPFATARSVPPWLYVIWHTTFPVLLALTWAPWPARFRIACPPSRRKRLMWGSQLVALTSSSAVVAFVVVRGPRLPVLIQDLDTSRMTSLTAPVAVPLVLASALYTAWALRGRSGPERWTSTAVWVCLIDLSLTYSSRQRFSLGWYTGRTLTVLAAAVVLVAMVHETSRVKSALVNALRRGNEVESLQRTILNNVSESVILSDTTGRVLMANDATRTMFPQIEPGERPPEATLRGAHGLQIPAEEWPTTSTSRTGEARRDVLFTMTSADDKQLWFRANTMAVPGSDGGISGVVSSYSDVTDRENARRDLEESARQVGVARDLAIAATEAKSAFLATMSHEIRTPLNAVIGMTGLLLDTELDDNQKDFTEHIRNSGEALLAIINDVLDFSKIEADELDLEEHPFDVRECVESALSLLALAAADKGVELMGHLESGCPELVLGDVTRFRQIVVNLVANAVKFTVAGEVVITVRALPSGSDPVGADQGGNQRPDSVVLAVSVRDTGIGIAPERIGRLFQPFVQADSSTTRKHGGTGLGLVISRRLAQAMAGDLVVTSEPGVGSTFTFTARLNITHDRRTGPPGLPLEALRGKTVLIVDDNATNRFVLRQLLHGWGMICIEAAAAGEALALMESTDERTPNFDVAVLDMHMPDVNGVQLAAGLRQLPVSRDLPLVLLSSLHGRLSSDERALFAAMLTKPVRSSLLSEKLLQVLAPAEHVLATVESAAGQRSGDGPAVGPKRLLRILMAEDNVVNQKVATGMLTKLGHRVDVVSDGLEAVQAVQLAPYDVVLMDMQMPQLDGIGATRQIRQILAGTEQPFIVALTANVLSEDRAACIAAGMDAFLAKPLRVQELDDVLTQFDSRPQPTSARRRSVTEAGHPG
jgi:signal transduction histidine kinase/DNA-binding response OmpR family regulator